MFFVFTLVYLQIRAKSNFTFGGQCIFTVKIYLLEKKYCTPRSLYSSYQNSVLKNNFFCKTNFLRKALRRIYHYIYLTYNHEIYNIMNYNIYLLFTLFYLEIFRKIQNINLIKSMCKTNL